MLAILEAYAMAVIGSLPPEKDAAVGAIVPRVFGGGTDWRATVRTVMGWSDRIDHEILDAWNRIALEKEPIAATDFAMRFADEHSND